MRSGRTIACSPSSRFDDKGEVFAVSAAAAGGQTIIQGAHRRISAPTSVVSNHPWNHAVIDRPLLFDARDGKLQQVQARPAGTETLTIGGRAVAARKYRIAGDLERELWCGPDGEWLQSRLQYKGAAITLTRQ